jgi:hypothetical protein
MHADFSARRCVTRSSSCRPLPIRLLLATPFLRDIPARMVAFGPQPYRLERADEYTPA